MQSADQMAKTSQKSNTSVQQIGEAILVCGGTASLTGQDLDVVNTALGVMADNGIKGSEGGTKLRNVLLSLSSPTKNGAAELERLGVSIYDAEGNMRQLDEIMGDLNKALSSLSQEEKTAAISTIFNKRDIAAINALLESTNGRFAELDALIKDSAGAAEEMPAAFVSPCALTTAVQPDSVPGVRSHHATLSPAVTPSDFAAAYAVQTPGRCGSYPTKIREERTNLQISEGVLRKQWSGDEPRSTVCV